MLGSHITFASQGVAGGVGATDATALQIALSVAPILATAAVSSAGVLLNDWRKGRDRETTLQKALSDAKQYTEFIDQWASAREKVAAESEKEEVYRWSAGELERTKEALLATISSNPPPSTTADQKALSAIRKVLLLGPMRSAGGRFFRGIFLTLATISAAVTVLLGLEVPDSALLTFFVIELPILLLLRFLASELERRGTRRATPVAPPTQWPGRPGPSFRPFPDQNTYHEATPQHAFPAQRPPMGQPLGRPPDGGRVFR